MRSISPHFHGRARSLEYPTRPAAHPLLRIEAPSCAGITTKLRELRWNGRNGQVNASPLEDHASSLEKESRPLADQVGSQQGCTVSKLSRHLRRHGMLRMRLPVSRRPADGRVHHSVLLREAQTSAAFGNQAVEIVLQPSVEECLPSPEISPVVSISANLRQA